MAAAPPGSAGLYSTFTVGDRVVRAHSRTQVVERRALYVGLGFLAVVVLALTFSAPAAETPASAVDPDVSVKGQNWSPWMRTDVRGLLKKDAYMPASKDKGEFCSQGFAAFHFKEGPSPSNYMDDHFAFGCRPFPLPHPALSIAPAFRSLRSTAMCPLCAAACTTAHASPTPRQPAPTVRSASAHGPLRPFAPPQLHVRGVPGRRVVELRPAVPGLR